MVLCDPQDHIPQHDAQKNHSDDSAKNKQNVRHFVDVIVISDVFCCATSVEYCTSIERVRMISLLLICQQLY